MFVRYQYEVLVERRRYDHAVKRIAVRTRQQSRTLRMRDRYRQFGEALCIHMLTELIGDELRVRQLAEPDLRRNLPG